MDKLDVKKKKLFFLIMNKLILFFLFNIKMNDTIKNELEMAIIVFKIRKIRLLSSAPLRVKRSIKKIRLFDIIEEKLLSIEKYDEE